MYKYRMNSWHTHKLQSRSVNPHTAILAWVLTYTCPAAHLHKGWLDLIPIYYRERGRERERKRERWEREGERGRGREGGER